jgi:predicted acylesterase/phospholipase RssA
VKLLPAKEVEYDVVGGISVGAANAGILASFKKGSELDAVGYIKNLWVNATREDLWQMWNYGPFEWFSKPSLLDSAPWHTTMR